MFDMIISNPPYHQVAETERTATQSVPAAVPLYHLFVHAAKKMHPQYICMILPAKWISGEARGLSSFKESMFQDQRLRKLFDYANANPFFDTVNIAGGGVCFFLWDRDDQGDCDITYVNALGEMMKQQYKLDPKSTYIRDLGCLSIIEKVHKATPENTFMNSMVSSLKPFGLRTFEQPKEQGDLTLRYIGGAGPFPRELITKNREWIDQWKVMLTKLGDGSNKIPGRVLNAIEILPPKHICTETYFIAGAFDTKQEAENLLRYLKTKFVRFLISRLASTQNLHKGKFKLVPIQDFTRPWTDEELYQKYALTAEEIALIESRIRPHESTKRR